MKVYFAHILLGLILIFSSCSVIDDEHEEAIEQDIIGAWLLYETGSSIGVGYDTVKVSATPAQIITFNKNKTISTSITEFSDYKYYRIYDDDVNHGKILAFFKGDPGTEVDLKEVKHSYAIRVSGDNLTLSYRFCIEGCHSAFERVKSINN